VAVFLPVVFMQQEAGQLFKDIAIAVTCAVIISLFVSVSVIPMFAKQFFCFFERREGKACDINDPVEAKRKMESGELDFPGHGTGGPEQGEPGKEKPARRKFRRPGALLQSAMMGIVGLSLKNAGTRIVTIVTLTAVAVVATWAFFPKMEYLPQGNRNLIINILIPPPGLSEEEFRANGEKIFAQLDPLIGQEEYNGMPGIDNVFYVGHPQFNLFGVISSEEQRAGELIPFLTGVANSLPGVFGVSIQAGIFQDRLGGGRSIDVDLSGNDMSQLVAAGGAMYGAISQALPGSQIRPVPSLELTFPEIVLDPVRDRVIASGMTTDQLGRALDVLMDGRQIGDFKQEGKKKIDLVLMASGKEIDTPEELYDSLLATPGGRIVPVSSLAELDRTTGITQIRHLERRRTVTLQVTPPQELPLESAMETISQGLVPNLKEQGALEGVQVRLAGAADKLTTTRQAMQGNFLLAVAIIYLLMSALFGNFIYPLVILFSLPMAAAGGFMGLKLQNIFLAPQPLDILTMLGFVILIGVVVNNAILIVHQALNNIREGGMDHKQAVLESVRTRLRPIYMSATTSIFGMLPLAVFPGPGSELYRGLGSVILGGLALSTIFTVFVIPALLMFFIKMEKVPARGEAS
jgi:HAE1 family hydrophobic/amphiphilic exporter-1